MKSNPILSKYSYPSEISTIDSIICWINRKLLWNAAGLFFCCRRGPFLLTRYAHFTILLRFLVFSLTDQVHAPLVPSIANREGATSAWAWEMTLPLNEFEFEGCFFGSFWTGLFLNKFVFQMISGFVFSLQLIMAFFFYH